MQPLTVSILSERRSFQPYGMAGGEGGQRGLNLLFIRGGEGGEYRVVSLGGKNTVSVSRGDRSGSVESTTTGCYSFIRVWLYWHMLKYWLLLVRFIGDWACE